MKAPDEQDRIDVHRMLHDCFGAGFSFLPSKKFAQFFLRANNSLAILLSTSERNCVLLDDHFGNAWRAAAIASATYCGLAWLA
jgi:uncharacterized secreted protein with C-terminal beta-propeller domain